MQEAHGGRLIGRRRFIQLGAAAGMTMFALGVTGAAPCRPPRPQRAVTSPGRIPHRLRESEPCDR